MNRLLSLGAVFDWITPLWLLIQGKVHQPSVGFLIPLSIGVTPSMIEELLQSYGVNVFGMTIHGGDIFFRVREAQADYAQYLLEREGLLFQHRPRRARTKRPDEGWLENIEGKIDGLANLLARQ